jgi:DnaJ-class molecular chaperone
MWQKCCACNGVGTVKNNSLDTKGFLNTTCTVCNGTKIISELTGLPPNFDKNTVERQRILDLTNQPFTDLFKR